MYQPCISLVYDEQKPTGAGPGPLICKDTPFATAEDMDRFYEHLEFTLVDIEFLKPEAPRQLMRRLKRLYNRVRLDEMELNILRGILSETQKKARKSDW